MDISLSKLWEIARDRGSWHAAIHVVAKSGTTLSDQTTTILFRVHFESVQFSCSVMSDSLQPHGLQPARLPWPSLSPRVCSNLCPLSWRGHPTISSSVAHFFSCSQSYPTSGSFLMSRFFTSRSQSIGTWASASVLSMDIQDQFPLGLTGLISLQSEGLSSVFSSTTGPKHRFFGSQTSLWSNSHIHAWLREKPYLWLYGPLSAKWCLCFLIRV